MAFDMDSALLWELAQDSAQEVAIVAAGLSMKESRNLWQNRWKIPLIKSLGELAAKLQLISFDSNTCGTQDAASEKVKKFLEGLELLCTVSHHILS